MFQFINFKCFFVVSLFAVAANAETAPSCTVEIECNNARAQCTANAFSGVCGEVKGNPDIRFCESTINPSSTFICCDKSGNANFLMTLEDAEKACGK